MCTQFGAVMTWEAIVKTLTRPIDLGHPPAEGDWDLDTTEAGDDDD